MFRFNLHNQLYVLLFLIVVYLQGTKNEDVKLGELPYCGSADDNSQLLNRFVFVSTLDGRLSALNVADGGSETWSMSTGPGPMLSSSIHRLELSNNGHWVRMIPSLSGGLYKFNGENIEAVPITADHLLKSSFRYSEDLVISGGKESRTYGVDVLTGRILYECSMSRCDNLTDDTGGGDVVLVQRQTQTVRAVEPRSGIERWNFSVGQHDVKLAPDPASDCHSRTDHKTSDVNFKVIVPEGLVCALSKVHPNKVVWTHKFNSPVVSAWVLDQGKLVWVDLFGGIRPELTIDEDPLPESPTLYIGMHNKQLYIQESVTMQNKLQEIAGEYRQHMITDNNVYPRIPWKPVPVTSAALGLKGRDTDTSVMLIRDEKNQAATTGLSVLYASEYVNGNGYYLYNSQANKAEVAICAQDENQNITLSEEEGVENNGYDSDSDMPVPIIIVSLWFWWKEVVVISVATAILVNLLLQRKFMHFLHHPSHELLYFKKHLASIEEKDSGISLRHQFSVNSTLSNEDNSFISRYLTDFDPVHRLGKGGFGVVFEAKNKIDDCHYAIKRIPLPNRQESRERVMREVKALAKLDHQNIVRYFNAWLECPPPGWQEQQDKIWNNKISAGTNFSYGEATSVDLTGHLTPEADSEKCQKTPIFQRNVPQPFHLLLGNAQWVSNDISSFDSEKNIIENDDSDSFIVFENSNKAVTNDDVFKPGDSVITLNSSSDKSSELTRSKSRKRPSSLQIDSESNTSSFPVKSSRMYLFIQMQLCRKESLREWLRDNVIRRDFNQVLSIFEQIVQAVEYVHLQGLIHRDLKPSNIFFSPDGQIKVGDFGLVTAMPENSVEQWTPGCDSKQPFTDERHTAQVGTQLYMSPEQLSGRPYNYKVDIYSLGLILFELLVPFNTQMERMRILTDLRHNKFPTDFQRDREEEFDLLRIMLSHSPDERPTTIGIRARPPLLKLQTEANLSRQNSWHFELPARRRNSSLSKSSSHSSNES